MAGTFGGATLTQTGKIGQDTIDPSDQYFGFGNLITSGGSAINSQSPFQTKYPGVSGANYTKIKGYDVKLVHGDRWQQLEATLNENILTAVNTTIGTPGKFVPVTPPVTASGYTPELPDPSNPTAAPPNPTTQLTDGKGTYSLIVGDSQSIQIGGNVKEVVGGSKNTVQVGDQFASFFSTYTAVSNGDENHWKSVSDSYQILNNDYKIVTDEKFRQVSYKVDHCDRCFATVAEVKIVLNTSVLTATGAVLGAVGAQAKLDLLKGVVHAIHAHAGNRLQAGIKAAFSTPFS
jgi:hypothetical protein